MPADQFDKDFGYLMPFIDKIAAASSGLADPAARAELSSLVANEKQRWERIRQLLSGASGKAANASSGESANSSAQGSPAVRPLERLTFTVGSLRNRDR